MNTNQERPLLADDCRSIYYFESQLVGPLQLYLRNGQLPHHKRVQSDPANAGPLI